MQCDTKGNWGAAPVRAPADCKAPAAVTNGKVTTDKTSFGASATVTCGSDYLGGGTANCGIAGWSALPKCFKKGPALAACPAGKTQLKSTGCGGGSSRVASRPCVLSPELLRTTGYSEGQLAWNLSCSADG